MTGRDALLQMLKKAEGNRGEVVEVYGKAKPDPTFPILLKQRPLTAVDARNMRKALASVVPYGALDETRLDLNGLQQKGLVERLDQNDRVMGLSRWWERPAYSRLEAENSRSRFVDAYLPGADVVALPSGSSAIAMHELGHAIDFNAFPKNSGMRKAIAHVYRNYAPTLWKEHAAWRKGRKAVEQAAAQRALRLAIAHRALAEESSGRRMGLGSYWGAGLGAVAGAVTPPIVAALANHSGKLHEQIPVVGMASRLASLLGAAVGGTAGFYLGKALSPSKVNKEQVAERLATAISKKTGEPQGPLIREILRAVERSEAARKAKKKPKTKTPEVVK